MKPYNSIIKGIPTCIFFMINYFLQNHGKIFYNINGIFYRFDTLNASDLSAGFACSKIEIRVNCPFQTVDNRRIFAVTFELSGTMKS